MRPVDAFKSLLRRTGGIQGCMLQEEAPGIWSGTMSSRMHLQEIKDAAEGVQGTMMGAIDERVMVVGSRADALAALEEVRQAARGGCVMLSPSGYPMIKGMGYDLAGKPRIPSPDGGWMYPDGRPA